MDNWLIDKDTPFTYDYEAHSTRTTLKEDGKHNVWFTHEHGNPDLLVHEPALCRTISPNGTALTHWPAAELAKHIQVCQEALAQLDFHKTAEEERKYDAYIQTLEVEEMLDQYQDAPYGMEER